MVVFYTDPWLSVFQNCRRVTTNSSKKFIQFFYILLRALVISLCQNVTNSDNFNCRRISTVFRRLLDTVPSAYTLHVRALSSNR